MRAARNLLAGLIPFLFVQAAIAQIAEPVERPALIPGPGEATVYFYKAGGIGRATEAWAFVDALAVGVIRGRQYVGVNIPEGEHLIWATSGSPVGSWEYLEAGQTYYFRLATARVNTMRLWHETADVERAVRDLARSDYMQFTRAGVARADEIFEQNFAGALESAEIENLARRVADGDYPPGSPESLLVIYAYAERLIEVGQWDTARQEYYTAITLIEEHHGDSSPILAEAYLLLAASYRSERIRPSLGMPGWRPLLTALEIAEMPQNSDPELLVRVLVEMGDARTAADREAAEYYLRAWDALEPLENADELRRALFSPERPIFVIRGYLSNDRLTMALTAEQGSVVAMFDVNEAGYATNIRIVSSNPPGLKDRDTIVALRNSRFRPKIQNREIVSVVGATAEYVFNYIP